MRNIFKYVIIAVVLVATTIVLAQLSDPPADYTNHYGLRMWDEGDYPGGDSINQNLIDIDNHIYKRDQRIDSLKTGFSWMHNFPAGTWKRYNSTEFDDDTLKVKSGVFAKLDSVNTFTSGEMKFDAAGPNGSTLNFIYTNGLGGVFINKNTSTSLLKFDEADGDYWQFGYGMTVDGDVDVTGAFKVNGVPLSSGGGDAYKTDTNTFTAINRFLNGTYHTDSLKVTGAITIVDSLKALRNVTMSQNLTVAGNITSLADITANNLWGDGSNITNVNVVNVTGLDSSKLFYVNRTDTLTRNINLKVGSNAWIKTLDNYALFLGANNDTGLEIDTGNSVRVYENLTVDGNVYVDGNYESLGDITAHDIVATGGFAGDGSGISGLEAANITSGTIDDARLSNNVMKDSSLFFRIISGITETVLAKVTFSDIVTFAVSPVYSIVVNFANGLTTTNMYASGYVQMGTTGRREYEVIKAQYVDTVGVYEKVLHGIADKRNIISLSAIIKHDTTGNGHRILASGYNNSTPMTVSPIVFADSLNFQMFIPTNSTGLLGDSIIFRALVSDNH